MLTLTNQTVTADGVVFTVRPMSRSLVRKIAQSSGGHRMYEGELSIRASVVNAHFQAGPDGGMCVDSPLTFETHPTLGSIMTESAYDSLTDAQVRAITGACMAHQEKGEQAAGN